MSRCWTVLFPTPSSASASASGLSLLHRNRRIALVCALLEPPRPLSDAEKGPPQVASCVYGCININ